MGESSSGVLGDLLCLSLSFELPEVGGRDWSFGGLSYPESSKYQRFVQGNCWGTPIGFAR